jgi:CheY-like chemotaxis protein
MANATLFVLSGDVERRETFVKVLSKAGWGGIVSTSLISEVVKTLRDTRKACAIVDQELDDIPALKAIPILRSLCDQIKIVFASAENSRDFEAQVRAADVFYYHVGPADSAEIVAAVKDAIGVPVPSRTQLHPKVLIVDDDPDFHAIVRTVLEPSGYAVLSAYSQREGLDMAREESPDIILLDIIMDTTTDGFAFCREARRDPRIRHTPILGVSAIEQFIAARRPQDADLELFPVDGFLSKPVTPEALFAELSRLVPREGQG